MDERLIRRYERLPSSDSFGPRWARTEIYVVRVFHGGVPWTILIRIGPGSVVVCSG